MHHRFSTEERVAAYLADPLRVRPAGLSVSDCDLGRLVSILVKNKVPLLGLRSQDQPEGIDWFSSPIFLAAVSEERAAWERQRAEFKIVQDALAAQGIDDVLIKSVGRAPSFPYRSDNLDVLYRPEHVDAVKKTLRELGYVELKNVEEPLKYLFRKFHAGRSVSAIHLHVHVGWMVSFLDEQRLWERRRPSADDPQVTTPGVEDSLLTTLAHWFYEDKCITLLDLIKYGHCLRQGVDWDEVYRVATWRGWRDGLNVALLLSSFQELALFGDTLSPQTVRERACSELPGWTRSLLERQLGAEAMDAVRRGEWPADGSLVEQLPLRVPFAFSKIFFYAKLVRDPTRSSARRLKDVAVHTGNGAKLRLRIHSQPRLLVTLSGVDGCGKTTQGKALQTALETCHLKVHYAWSRGGSSPLLRLLRRRYRAQANADLCVNSVDKFEVRRQRFRSPWVRWGWPWFTTVELLGQYLRHIVWPLARGRIVIADRYLPDAFADWAANLDQTGVEHGLPARLLRLLSPRPRFAYWLDVSVPTAQDRSKDQAPARWIEAQREMYRSLASRALVKRIDGEASSEDISNRIVYEVFGAYFGDYHTFINTLFLKNPGQWK